MEVGEGMGGKEGKCHLEDVGADEGLAAWRFSPAMMVRLVMMGLELKVSSPSAVRYCATSSSTWACCSAASAHVGSAGGGGGAHGVRRPGLGWTGGPARVWGAWAGS